MKLALVVSDLTAPPREGLHQQTLLRVDELLRAGVEVSLFGYCKDPDLLDEAWLLREHGLTFAQPPIPNRLPTLLLGCRNRLGLRRTADEATLLRSLEEGNFDVLHLEAAAACGLFRRRATTPSVLSLVDPPSRRAARLAREHSGLRGRLLLVAQAALGYVFEASLRGRRAFWHVVSPDDASYLRRSHRRRRVCDIPVSLPLLDEPTAGSDTADGDGAPASPTDVVPALVFADLRHEHMRSAFRRLVETVLRPAVSTEPRLRFTVLGRTEADSELLELCRGIPITFVAWAEDYLQEIRDASLVILPDTVGTGLKNRTLQCLGLSRATLGSTVAFEGIPAVDGRDAVIYSDPADALEGLIRLARDPGLRGRLGESGRELVIDRFGGAEVRKRWLRFYREVSALHGRNDAA